MKKISFLIISLVLLASCKKKYNCFCNTTIKYPSGQDYYVSNNKPMSEKMNKKQAKATCDNEAENINQTYYNFFTNNGNWSANGTTFYTQCSVQ